jgi:peptide/nickel transport system substrate-binding protein
MKKLRWQFVIIFLTGIVVGVLLLGEQSSENPSIEPQPTRGGVYSEALVGSIQRLNPVLDYYNPVDRDIDRLIYSSLMKFDDQGNPQLDLAESWGVSQDGKVYNLTLRKGLQWQDGEPLTTNDVLFTIELMREGGEIIPSDLQNFWEEVDVVALSDDTVQFRLPEAFSPFPDYLTFGILPAHLLADLTFDQIVDSDFNLHPIGSGPYQMDHLIVEYDQITGVVLSVNSQYYGQKPYIEQIVFRYYPDQPSALTAYQEGVVQGIGNVSNEILSSVMQEPNLSVYSGREPELTMIFLNLNNPQVAFFQDATIRKALLLGLNRQYMVDQLLHGQALIANGVILPYTWAYYDGLQTVEYDPQAAKLILKEQGYVISSEGGDVREKDGEPFSFELIYPDNEFYQSLAETVQKDWAELNIDVQLTPLTYDEIINERLQSRNYEAVLINLNFTRYPDPDPYPFWDQAQATGGQNYSQWDDRSASDYLEQARISLDRNERAKLYRNFQVVFSEQLPSLPLYFPVYNYAVDQGVQGVRVGPIFDPSDRFATIADWYLVAQKPGTTPESTAVPAQP